MHRSARWLPRLQVAAAALLFSTGGVAVKGCGLTAWQVASFRCGLAALTLLILVPAARRGFGRRSAVVGLAYAATLTLYVLANKNTTAANAIFLQGAAPLYVLVLAPLLLGERFRARDLGLMAAMALGLWAVLSGEAAAGPSAPNPMLGNLFAAAAGGTWALTVVGLRWLERHGTPGRSALPAVVSGNVLAFAAVLPLALPVAQSRPADWAWIGYLGVVQIAVAYLLLVAGLRHLRALEASLLLLIEPVFNPVWAWWLEGEVPGLASIVGGILILAATVTHGWLAAAADGGEGSGPPARGASPG